MSGMSTHLLESIFFWSTFAACILGGLGLIAALIAGFTGFESADREIKLSHEKIRASEVLIAEAGKAAAEAGEEIAKANERTAALAAEANNAHLALEKLRTSVAWRELSKEEVRRLVAPLAKFRGNAEVIGVTWMNGNPEAANFAGLLAKTLSEAGLNVEPPGNEIVMANIAGISLRTNDGPLAKAVLSGLRDAGMPVAIAEPWHPVILIRVGSKPQK